MRRTYAAFAVAVLLVLGTTGIARAACTASDTTLCLNGGRFSASVAWTDFQGRTGVGTATPITADTGYFWFFSSTNIELVIKVLDARTVNGKFWVFFGALSNVEYTLTVTDTVTGAQKQYVNPSGQFASVGDTKAFDPSGTSTTSVRVEGTAAAPASIQAVQGFIDAARVAPKDAADFTPCPDAPFGFNLSGCRFHIEVSWDDGHGRTGIGHPVQLTNDTGYFWFFADTNVELMIKVLDARPVNGNFWVFFGALSNVQYSVTVTDSVTNGVKRYANPSGTFASVGDTKAFVGGRKVAPVRDAVSAVSADLDATGGSFSATGADGTVFTLEVPPQALTSPETITLTPVSSVGGFPFSGGFHTGVEIEPEGLRLLTPATLSIRPAAPLPLNQTLTYAYAKGGEDFILYPRLNDAADVIQIPLFHFSGYGSGGGGEGDAGAPTSAGQLLAPYVQAIARWKFLEVFNQITHDEFNEHLVDILEAAFNELAFPLMMRAKEACDRAEIEIACQVTFEIVQLVQVYGLTDSPQLVGISAQAFDLAKDILTTCQQKTFDKCVYFNDPFEATLMLYIAQQLQVFGVDDPYLTTFMKDGLMERCLRFEVDFESRINESIMGRGTAFLAMNKYRAQTVPLRLNLANFYAYSGAWEGGCTLSPELNNFQYTAGGFGCTASVTADKGFFSAPACWIEIFDETPSVKLLYRFDPEPVEHTEIHCQGTDHDDDSSAWAGDYDACHEADFSTIFGLFIAKHWTPLRVPGGGGQNGEFFANKIYEKTIPVPGGTLSEETVFYLKHTPDKPDFTCP
jgi:hypothetical protein